SGRLKVTKPLGKRVTYHDPCHLGRLNKEYDAPRRVLKAIGCELVEMPRSRDNSFCCGAGGGRIWTPDPPGVEKPSHSRMHEAAALGDIDVFVTTCPKDLAMFEDARKASGHEKDFVVSDIAELVAEAIELKAVPANYLPELADRIAESLADKVAARVVPELMEALLAQTGRLQLAAPAAAAEPVRPDEAAADGMIDLQPDAEGAWSVSPVRPAVLADYERPAKEGVRVLVAVKHVAKLGDEFDFIADGTDVRPDDLDHQLNEFDETAVEAALQLVEQLGQGEVVAVTVGTEDAEPSLRRALAKGAHRGVRVWSDRVSPSDPIAVASLLAGVAVLEQPDLILTGVQSSDFANGATASALGGVLGWPHAAVVVALQWDGTGRLAIERELEGGVRHRQDLPWPAVLSIQSGANVPRYATMRMIKEARTRTVAEPQVADLDQQALGGLVVAVERPPLGQAAMIDGSAAEVADRIAAIIRDKRGV
ncbi:MAG: electron transfer flavoprotein subunit alpha, partial [Aquamicrobium sp.]|nr:electron transfer flavoprotein subunit alpha [Aquamicrobium sp.]